MTTKWMYPHKPSTHKLDLKLHTAAASKLSCEHDGAQFSSPQGVLHVKLLNSGSWQIHSEHTPTQTCGGITLYSLMLDCTAWTMWTMLCMLKSSSYAGNKANMSSVSSKTLLCHSSLGKSTNLETADFWFEAALHNAFAIKDQPKAHTLLASAAHPCFIALWNHMVKTCTTFLISLHPFSSFFF